MSYDVYLKDPVTGETLELTDPHHMRGGTYRLGGTTEAHLNVTYNYSKHLGRVLPGGVRGLYGKNAAETVPVLEAAAAQLGDDVSDDYWQPTEGNVKRAVLQLTALARMLPHGVWSGD